MMGFTGNNLTDGVVDPAGCRTSAEDIIAFLSVFLPGFNVSPEAHAGHDQTVAVNTIVQLDGHRSTDQNGNPLTYGWTFVQRPQGSTATLLNPNSFNHLVPGLEGLKPDSNDGFG